MWPSPSSASARSAVTGIQARRARRGPTAAGSDGVRRYFRPGVNWAARALYGVPVFGFALISSSSGAFAAGDGFVVAGLGLWALAAVVAEAVVWPGERRIQEVVSTRWGNGEERRRAPTVGSTTTAAGWRGPPRCCRSSSSAPSS